MPKPEVISVVAGGWSVAQVNLEKISGHIIGVNDSPFYLPRWNEALTMDRIFAENRFDRYRSAGKVVNIRRSAMKNLQTHRFPWLHVFECDHESFEFSDVRGILNGTSSGMCAFNLAYQWKPKAIFLFGFDMCLSPTGEAHWYPPYEWSNHKAGKTTSGKYSAWSRQFDRAAKICKNAGIEVTNVSASDAIKSFKRLTPKQFNEMEA